MNRQPVACLLLPLICGVAPAEVLAQQMPELPAAASVVTAEVPEPRFEWGVAYASRYVFQGLDYSDGQPVFQPQLTARLGRYSAIVWSNLDQDRRELNEIDVSLQGDWENDGLSGDFGYTHLRYPHRGLGWEPTHELYADLELDRPLQPSISVHWDLDQGHGRYWTLGLSHEMSAAKSVIQLSGRLYAHDGYYDLTGLPCFEAGVGFSRGWGRLSIQSGLARQWTWENGDFRGDNAVPAGWVATVALCGAH